MTPPTAAASAAAEPETPPKIMDATTLIRASPPGTQPTRAKANWVIRFPMPPSAHDLPGQDEEGQGEEREGLVDRDDGLEDDRGANFPLIEAEKQRREPDAKARGMAVTESPRKSPQMMTKFMG